MGHETGPTGGTLACFSSRGRPSCASIVSRSTSEGLQRLQRGQDECRMSAGECWGGHRYGGLQAPHPWPQFLVVCVRQPA